MTTLRQIETQLRIRNALLRARYEEAVAAALLPYAKALLLLKQAEVAAHTHRSEDDAA